MTSRCCERCTGGGMRALSRFRRGLACALAGLAVLGAAAADVRAQEPRITLELNGIQAADAACRVSFLAQNLTGEEIKAAVFEVAVIDGKGLVSALIRLDFGRLPDGKSRVRQFDLAGQSCDAIGRVLLNDVAECTGDGLSAQVCLDALAVSSRTGVAFDL